MNLHRRFRCTWREELHCTTGIYLRRWTLEFWWFSIRLHHWMHSDDSRAFHDHPWWFVTFVLKGGYTDVSPKGEERIIAPTICYRPAEHAHTVKVFPGGCWTLVVTGPKVRRWGFWVKNKFVKSYKYFYRFGNHQCD